MRTWYSITNAAGSMPATVSIFDEIGLFGITAADFNRQFKAITAKVINLEINSPGGSVFDGIAIYNMLKGSGKTINAKVMGIAASIASVILMAADKIVMPSNAMQMVHSPKGGMFGTAEEMCEMADVLDKVKASLIGTYVKRTGKTEDEVKAMLAKDTWMTAAEAKEAGFADEVIDAVEVVAKYDTERVPEAYRGLFKAVAAAPSASPAPSPAPTSPPVAQNAIPLADQIVAAAKAADFEAYAPAWAVKYTNLDEVTARIAEAKEIKAVCTVIGKADKADALIRSGKTLVEARRALIEEAAAADVHIDTSRRVDSAARMQGMRAADIYAQRRNAASR